MRPTFNTEIANYVRQGWTVESQTDTQAILVKPQRIGWFWNIVLSFLTCGIWLIVVAYKLINRKKDRLVLTADEAGYAKKGSFSRG
jgi:hypothetical protein